MATPAPETSTPPVDKRQLALDLVLTLGVGLLVVGGRLLVDALGARGFGLAGLGALAVAGSLLGREARRPAHRGVAVVAAVVGVGLLVAALVG